MMPVCPDIWDVLHDATVTAATGLLPGTISLTIECDYLRDRFSSPGGSFLLSLDGCTKFQFRSWQDDLPIITSIETIGQLRLWLLSADQREQHCQIHCQFHGREGGGSLEVIAESARLQLDTGAQISLAEIAAVADAYWTDCSHHIQTQPDVTNDLQQRLKGTESLKQLTERFSAEKNFDTELELTPGALRLFIDRYLRGELTASELENVADLVEQRVEYVPEPLGAVMAQVLFEMSSPEVNGTITPELAKKWKTVLRKPDDANES
jgi:hypothetical protein